MQVKVEDVSPVEKKLIVEVPWNAVDTRMGDAFRELTKSVQLKGFRKGKVPRSVLERMFGKRVRAEVAGQLVRESFVTAMTEHKLEPVSEPRVEDAPEIQTGQPFSFTAIVEVRGDIHIADWKGMQLGRRPVVVGEDAVDMALEQLRREHTELRPIEGREVLAESDVAAIALKGKVGEHDVDKPQMPVDLGDAEHEPLPGLRTALIGLPLATADHPLEIAIPDDFPDPQLAGRTAALTVSVLDARQKDVPDLDDELAKDTGRAESLAELRGVVRAELEARVSQDIDDEVRKEALAELVKRNPIPVASSLIERSIESKYQRLRQLFGMQADDAGDLDSELREKLRASATDDVRGQLLLDAVATQEGIEVPEEDLDDRIARLARPQGQAPGRLRSEMDRDGRLDSLRFQIRQEKTLDRLVEHAEVTERIPEPEPESVPPDQAGSDAPEAASPAPDPETEPPSDPRSDPK
ncbi:MAG TPA: trigger factor [Kofleriaceae bacterium]|nr:trigger factor [Kofleriaceae bacterium]